MFVKSYLPLVSFVACGHHHFPRAGSKMSKFNDSQEFSTPRATDHRNRPQMILVGGLNPSSQLGWFFLYNIWENKQCSKPLTRIVQFQCIYSAVIDLPISLYAPKSCMIVHTLHITLISMEIILWARSEANAYNLQKCWGFPCTFSQSYHVSVWKDTQ